MSVTLNLFRHSKEFEQFPAGEVIFKEGTPGDVMYVIQEGEVDILIHGRVIETVGVGGVVGEMALIDKGPRSATVIAKTDAKIVPVDNKQFEFLVQETPFFATQVMRILVDRLRMMDAIVAE
jgi:CRP/FNR family transcriptional regulator, cyclic AMP receptor protein